ncbi:hypothetical protein KBC55_02470 [Patescibacteria group bacterium]|nr:hypothetical protein [Patescibacteria group bacterium]
MDIFIVCGYGIPENMETDTNYLVYLRTVFNKLYSKVNLKPAAIISCGGPTSMKAPYTNTEAAVITQALVKQTQREELQSATKLWKFYEEGTSLSTLENLLNAKKIIEDQQLSGNITIFCEATREHRITETAKKIFQRSINVEPIDFDTSINRYLNPERIKEKEEIGLQESLWTLEDANRLALHHELFEKKFIFFRNEKEKGLSETEIVKRWYEKMDDIIKEAMPDHPLFKNKTG